MSDDRKFQIKIETVSDSTGVQNAAQDLDQLGKKTNQAGEDAKLFNEHSREMHRIFGELNKISPGLGETLKGIFSPETLGVGVALVALEQLVKYLGEARQKAEEAATASVALWVAQRDAANAAIKAAADYNIEIGKSIDAQKTLNDQFNAEKTILDAIIEQRKKVLGAAGQDIPAEEDRLQLQRTQLEELRGRAPVLKESREIAAHLYQMEEGSPEAAAAAERLKGKDETKLIRDLQKMEEIIADQYGYTHLQRYNAMTDLPQAKAALAQFRQDKATVETHTENLERLKTAQEEAITAYKQNKEAIDRYTSSVNTAAEVLAIHEQTDRLTNVPGIIGAGMGALKDARTGRYSSADVAAVAKLSQLSTDTGLGPRGLFDAINKLIDMHVDQKYLSDAIVRRVQSLENTRQLHPPGLQ